MERNSPWYAVIRSKLNMDYKKMTGIQILRFNVQVVILGKINRMGSILLLLVVGFSIVGNGDKVKTAPNISFH